MLESRNKEKKMENYRGLSGHEEREHLRHTTMNPVPESAVWGGMGEIAVLDLTAGNRCSPINNSQLAFD